jgi:hypothetical protein
MIQQKELNDIAEEKRRQKQIIFIFFALSLRLEWLTGEEEDTLALTLNRVSDYLKMAKVLQTIDLSDEQECEEILIISEFPTQVLVKEVIDLLKWSRKYLFKSQVKNSMDYYMQLPITRSLNGNGFHLKRRKKT